MLKNSAKQSEVHTSVNAAFPPIEQRPIYKTVEQFSKDNSFYTPSALRNLIFKADERQSTNGVIAGNGLLDVGAIIRVGRKVLINEDRFYHWIESQNIGSQK